MFLTCRKNQTLLSCKTIPEISELRPRPRYTSKQIVTSKVGSLPETPSSTLGSAQSEHWKLRILDHFASNLQYLLQHPRTMRR
jgi:hypothetical protein